MSNPFDYTNSITYTKKNLIRDTENPELAEKQYNAFLTNRGLSYFPDTIMYANDMNMRPELDSLLQYEYFNSNFSKYFTFAEVLWKISGPLYDVKENGILMQGGVIDSNLRSISEARKLIPGIENYLTNLTLYYKP